MAMGSLLTPDYVVSNDGSASDETALGAVEIFDSVACAEQHFEYWIGEEPGVRFYDGHGERLEVIDHGNRRSFHFQRTGIYFEGFPDLIAREAKRLGVEFLDGSPSEDIVRAIFEWGQDVRQKRCNFWDWLLPSCRRKSDRK